MIHILTLVVLTVATSNTAARVTLSHKNLHHAKDTRAAVQSVRKMTHAIERLTVQESSSGSDASTKSFGSSLSWDTVCKQNDSSSSSSLEQLSPLLCAKLSPKVWFAPFAPQSMDSVLMNAAANEEKEEDGMKATMESTCLQTDQPCGSVLMARDDDSSPINVLQSLVQMPTTHECRSCIDQVYQSVVSSTIQPHVTETLVATIDVLRTFASSTNHTDFGALATLRADSIQNDLMPLLMDSTAITSLHQLHVVRTLPTSLELETALGTSISAPFWVTACCADAVVMTTGPSLLDRLTSVIAHGMAAVCVFAALWGWQLSYQTRKATNDVVATTTTTTTREVVSTTTTLEDPVAAATATTPEPAAAAARSIQSSWRKHRSPSSTAATSAGAVIYPFATTQVRETNASSSIPHEVNVPTNANEEASATNDSQDSSLPDLVPQQLSPRHVTTNDKKKKNRNGKWLLYALAFLGIVLSMIAGATVDSKQLSTFVDDTVASARTILPPGAVSYMDEVLFSQDAYWYGSSSSRATIAAEDAAILRRKQWASSPKNLGGAYGPMIPF